MILYKAFYKRKYRYLICWDEVDEITLLGQEIIQLLLKKSR